MIAALVALPEGSERKLGGLFQVTLRKGLRKLPPLYAIPTTAAPAQRRRSWRWSAIRKPTRNTP